MSCAIWGPRVRMWGVSSVRLRRAAVAAFAAGAAVLILVGLSMLAARDTLNRSEGALRPWATLMDIEAGARPPFLCSATAGQPGTFFAGVATIAEFRREAACLRRHGLLTSEQVAQLSRAARERAAPMSVLFPSGWQIVPTTTVVSLWLVLFVALAAAALWLTRSRRNGQRPPANDLTTRDPVLERHS